MVSISWKGIPTPKGRPRLGKGRTYTPAKTRNAEKDLAWTAKQAMELEPPLVGPLSMLLFVYLPVPKSWSKTKRQKALDCTIYPTARPDLDNYVKLVCDALNNVVFVDDSQIIGLSATKLYNTAPGLRIEIMEVTGC